MNRIVALAVVGVLCFFSSVRADDSKLASKDEKFLNSAATGGDAEVALGKVAEGRATNQDVKNFAQKMVDDHTKANDELKDLAKQKGVDLTKAEDKATKMESKEETSLSKKERADFDKAYMDQMVKDHDKTVKEFEKAANDAEDADVKTWASKTLPTLQHHLEVAKEIQGKLGK